MGEPHLCWHVGVERLAHWCGCELNQDHDAADVPPRHAETLTKP